MSSCFILVIWYNPLLPQVSKSDEEEDQETVQEDAVDLAPTDALVDPNHVEPQGANEEEDLAPMPDLEEYARILQRLAIEQSKIASMSFVTIKIQNRKSLKINRYLLP